MTTRSGEVLLVGPNGVVGTGVRDYFEHDRRSLVTVSRNRPRDIGVATTRHLAADLLNEQTSVLALGGLEGVTRVVYAAYSEGNTPSDTVIRNVTMLRNVLTSLDAAGAKVEHVVLIGGGKSYGEHLGRYKTPAKESDPRLPGPIFYNDQEDLLIYWTHNRDTEWTVLRPDIVLGPSAPGSPMNLLRSIGVYGNLSRRAGQPLRFPGSPKTWTVLHQATDAAVLAQAVGWALEEPAARGQIFNVTNGDLFRWEHVWTDIAAALDLPVAAPQPMRLSQQLSDQHDAWDKIVDDHNLRPSVFGQMAGWDFADAVWASDYDLVQSTTKIRQAGFHACVDTHESFVAGLNRLQELRLIA